MASSEFDRFLEEEMRNGGTPLPAEFSWEAMEAGIEAKMADKRRRRRMAAWWWWGALLGGLLLIGSIAYGWYAWRDAEIAEDETPAMIYAEEARPKTTAPAVEATTPAVADAAKTPDVTERTITQPTTRTSTNQRSAPMTNTENFGSSDLSKVDPENDHNYATNSIQSMVHENNSITENRPTDPIFQTPSFATDTQESLQTETPQNSATTQNRSYENQTVVLDLPRRSTALLIPTQSIKATELFPALRPNKALTEPLLTSRIAAHRVSLHGGGFVSTMSAPAANVFPAAASNVGIRQSDETAFGAQAGLRYQRTWANRWTTGIGLFYQDVRIPVEFVAEETLTLTDDERYFSTIIINSVTNDTNFVAATTVNGVRRREVRHLNTYRYLAIPLEVGYRFGNGNTQVQPFASLAPTYRLRATGKVVELASVNVDLADFASGERDERLASSWGWQWGLGLAVHQKVSTRIELFAEARYARQLNHVYDPVQIRTSRPEQLSLNAGIAYRW